MKADSGNTVIQAVEVLAWKLGALLLSLGFMHFTNLYIFYRIRRRARLAHLPPPVLPQMRAQFRESGYEPGRQAAGIPSAAHSGM